MALAQKKGGPYPKDEQRKRRDEVYRLHFEYGYSARKIAEFLKINRGTINRDIMYWYAYIEKKWRHFDPVNFVMKQIERLELQRTRLRKQLENVESFQEKITIEKFILNLDVKIANFQIRIIEARRNIHRETAKNINEWFEKEKIGKRVIPTDILFEISGKAQEKIYKIYSEDMKF